MTLGSSPNVRLSMSVASGPGAQRAAEPRGHPALFPFLRQRPAPVPPRRGEAAGVSVERLGIYGDNKKLIDSLVVFGSSYFFRNSTTKHYDSGKNLGGFWYVKILDKLIASLVDESKGDFSSTN